MNVIDLSDWNENVDWSRFIDHGIGGVIVKISEGRTLSELFAKNIAGAAARGLPWGVYCFSHAQTTERAEEEAQVVIDALETLGYGAPDLGNQAKEKEAGFCGINCCWSGSVCRWSMWRNSHI